MSIIENQGAPVVAPARLVDAIRSHSDHAPALIAGHRTISYGELIDRVRRRRDELALSARSVVVLSGTNSAELVVTYLALLDAGHVPLLAAPGAPASQLTAAWSPAATVHVEGDDLHVTPQLAAADAGTGPSLHPDLALLLSTSGSTGSPKLVRLSQRNLVANAASIVEYLQLTAADCGITTLPLHYCYGLSVLHSHLLAGASVVLTDASVVDPCFRRALADHGVTNVAGVPHTFDMLEQSGADSVYEPSLRLLTQAGGRMAPADVARWVDRSAGRGVDFYVMYGQTEATARMAYLPPDLAAHRPGTIGRAIPGGTLRVEPVTETEPVDSGRDADGGRDVGAGRRDADPGEIGELVYSGDNVMMGYATDAADLARGHDLTELRTGDLARFHADDEVYEIVGRRARFVKPFGLRIDLDELERRLVDRLVGSDGDAVAVAGDKAVAVAGDDSIIVVAAPSADEVAVVDAVTDLTGLPASRIVVDRRPAIARLASGKVDYAALLDAASEQASDPAAVGRDDTTAGEHVDTTTRVRRIYAVVLGRHDVSVDDTFVSLGGDSLSYVECSIRLEQVLGDVPPDWHLSPISELAAVRPRRRWLPRVDTTLVLRALAICLIVGTHMRVWFFPGGAHLLLAVVGYNLARFVAPIDSTRERVVAGLRTAARAAVPAMLWAGAGVLVFGAYSLGTVALVNNYVGPASHADDHWHFWFIEVFVHLVLVTTLLLAIPMVRRTERRRPYLFALGLLGVTLVLRMEWAWMDDWYNIRYRTHAIAWFFVLGWLVRQSTTLPQRLLTTALCLTVVPGFFQYAPREWFIAAALVVLLWAREVPVPRPLVQPIALLAAASLWIYITHFTFWPLLTDVFVREVAYVVTIASGVAVWAAVRVAATRWSGRSGGLVLGTA